MKFAFYTLGCKTNQYETQAMEQLLVARGHCLGSFQEACDAYVVNTCSVTAVADKKNRAVIRRCRREHPEAVLAVCGCYTQHDAPAVRALGVDVIGGSGDRQLFLEDLLAALETRQYREHLDVALRRRAFEPLPAGSLEDRTRAMLKVQDGCVNFCTYCIIPYTRGPVRSLDADTAVSQALVLAEKGYREIVLTGIEIAGWGLDLPGKPPVSELITKICRAVPALRIRLGSLEPRIVTPEFCRELAALPNLCPQFHLSLQSGCDTVLARMKRKYDTARYLQSLQLLRDTFPGCAITTDMIVGFPGETEEEFAQSLAFIQVCAFSDMHIFPYSRRPGTPAAEMPGQLGNSVKEERCRRAIETAAQMNLSYRHAAIGSTMTVLFEQPEDGLFAGHTDTYLKIYVEADGLHNRLCRVRLTGICREGLLGELEEEA